MMMMMMITMSFALFNHLWEMKGLIIMTIAVVFRSQWSSGRRRDGPGSNRAADKSLCFHENHCDTQLWARAAHSV